MVSPTVLAGGSRVLNSAQASHKPKSLVTMPNKGRSAHLKPDARDAVLGNNAHADLRNQQMQKLHRDCACNGDATKGKIKKDFISSSLMCAASFPIPQVGVGRQSWQRIWLENGLHVKLPVACHHAHVSKLLQPKRSVLERSGEHVVISVLRR